MSDIGQHSYTDDHFTFTETFSPRTKNSLKIPNTLINKVSQYNRKPEHVVLSCDVNPEIIWGLKLEGRKLTVGWPRFAEKNAFENGDILLFEYNGNATFHVERYHKEDNEGMGGEATFVTFNVTPDNIRRSRMFLPQDFVDMNELDNFAGEDILILTENGMKFNVLLNKEPFSSEQRVRMRLTKGLKEFFQANDIKPNDELTMQLLWNEKSTPTLKLLSKVIVLPN